MPAGKNVTFKSGSGTTSGSGGVLTITTGTAVGTNTAGANLVLNAGKSTGNNTSNAAIVFRVATAATGSGTDTNDQGDAVSITSGKALQIHPTSGNPSVSGSGEVDIDFLRAGDRIFILQSGGTDFSLTGSNATNEGQQGSIVIVNDSSGNPTVTWKADDVWYFENGNPITIPNTNDLIHIFSYYIYASGKVLISGSTSFSQYTS
jgi:hypothetical protein